MASRSTLLSAGLLWLVVQVGCAPTAPRTPPQTVLVGTVQASQRAGVRGIEVMRGGALLKAGEKMALEAGDELRTDALSRAVIQFPDTSWIIMEPNTAVRISSLGLIRGTILAKARKWFQVETLFVMVTVEGTEYQVRVNENNQTSVDVAAGLTRLTSATGAWEPVAVREREGAVVGARDFPQKRALTPEEVARIREQFRMFGQFFITDLIGLQGMGPGPGIGPGMPGPGPGR